MAEAAAVPSEGSGEVAAEMEEAELPVVVVVEEEEVERRMVRLAGLVMWMPEEMLAAVVVVAEFVRWPEKEVFRWLRRLR